MNNHHHRQNRPLYSINFRIADVIIQMHSRFKPTAFTREDLQRLQGFIYQGGKKADICLSVKLVEKLPALMPAKRLFLTKHPEQHKINWGLYKKNSQCILRTYPKKKEQYILLNNDFNRAQVFVLADEQERRQWKAVDIIYDALQIIIISYLLKREGIVVHAMGLKDIDGRGMIFPGRSGAGKSTLARLWQRHSRAMVLNDDRIIIRKIKGAFFIYSSPWHGDFSDYLVSKMGSARPLGLLFIRHSPKNSLTLVSNTEAFRLLYPCLFPSFWDKQGLKRMLNFCQDLIQALPCYKLGVRKDRSVIGFVRRIT